MELPSNNQWTKSFSITREGEEELEETPSVIGGTFDKEVYAVILSSAASHVEGLWSVLKSIEQSLCSLMSSFWQELTTGSQ